ncbi:germination protein GerPD [Paenibacillus mucilaginosus]|uniref:Spore germination protein GerPD n=2 Tax=Paenibacillus mucilaginosus TaxID=61624 RepID=H6NB97_9BACL|nr:germination protein GerPD [Paenibacillus mucilaginosus]AEI42524.1 spore germination protein GerPD [Paenibacillus mucilaginosus KNP414]AFC32065.1 spore germination protein GerPD [Paenibacillus mucilaginosus 3016]MCG7213917.1 spore gernimation protein GerPD [Paenibacillus mucilaginosus]WDM25922.1 spore gernimation protein GerPD [Paenibacillus mucilaginosus]WFA20574.1 spore gernimation protein GerPD [Paenibacillus mucilaginosus]
MNLFVDNKGLHVGNVHITGVASASLFLIGDANLIRLSSVFDTPPESLIIGPLEPLNPEEPE